MRSGFLLFILIVLSMNAGFSQENYLPGKVITIENDTIKGEINYLNWDKNPITISFRKNAASEPVMYSPLQISSFEVSDEMYVSAMVKINESAILTNELTRQKEIEFGTVTVFLQTMIKGAKSLLYLKDEKGREHYYIDVDGKKELLLYHRYLKDTPTSTIIAEDKRFIGQLSYYLSDCAEMRNMTASARYEKSSLGKIFRQYYECVDKRSEFVKHSDEKKIEFGIVAGMSITWLKFTANENYHSPLIHSQFPGSYNPSFGVYMNKKLSRNFGKSSVYNELFGAFYKTSLTYTTRQSENQYETDDMTLGGFYLKLNSMFRYSIPMDKMTFYLQGGVVNGFNLHETNVDHSKMVFYATVNERYMEAISATRKYSFGITGGAGVSAGKFSLECRYEQNNGMSTIQNLKSSVRIVYLLLGYRF